MNARKIIRHGLFFRAGFPLTNYHTIAYEYPDFEDRTISNIAD